jgi:SAM-dependent methyltransferase
VNHRDHVALIAGGLDGAGPVWADLGSGDGAFTLALAELLGPVSRIYSVDRDRAALRRQESAMESAFPATRVDTITADFSRELALPSLDGVLMANSLHFQREKQGVLGLILAYLRPGGRLILVEYDTDQGNHWVPYPLSFTTWQRLATANGFEDTRLLATRPSRFLGRIFSAVSFKAPA